MGSLRHAIGGPTRFFTVILPLLLRVLWVSTEFFRFGPCIASSESSIAWRDWQMEPLSVASSLLLRFTGSNQSRSSSSPPPHFPPCCGLSLEIRPLAMSLFMGDCPSAGFSPFPVIPVGGSSESSSLHLIRFSPSQSGHSHPRVGE